MSRRHITCTLTDLCPLTCGIYCCCNFHLCGIFGQYCYSFLVCQSRFWLCLLTPWMPTHSLILHVHMFVFHWNSSEIECLRAGQVTLDKHQLIKTVVNKTDQIDNTFRFFKMEVLAGEDNLVATINENGCSFTFDFSKVYWNSRLHSEHNRLVVLLKRGESVLDVFAGVGPFSIPAAKNGCVIYANDLNPHSYNYLCENAKRNKVHKQISTYNLDGREFIRKITEPFLDKLIDGPSALYSHVIMNLPAIAHTFLDTFRGLFSRVPHSRRRELVMPMIHCYGFSKCPNSPEQDSLNTVAKSLGVKELIEGTYSLYVVRKVAPNKTMTRVSFQLPEEVAYAQGTHVCLFIEKLCWMWCSFDILSKLLSGGLTLLLFSSCHPVLCPIPSRMVDGWLKVIFCWGQLVWIQSTKARNLPSVSKTPTYMIGHMHIGSNSFKVTLLVSCLITKYQELLGYLLP